MNLGDAIKLIRTAKKRKQVDLAAIAGVSPNYFCMVEANKKIPSLDFLEKVANELDVPAGLFLLWSDSERPRSRPPQAKKLRDLLVEIQAIYFEPDSSEESKNVTRGRQRRSAKAMQH